VLAVNLDNSPAEAKAFLTKNKTVATHVYAAGLESNLATEYGVVVLPAVFVIGKDGKCISKNAQWVRWRKTSRSRSETTCPMRPPPGGRTAAGSFSYRPSASQNPVLTLPPPGALSTLADPIRPA